MTRSSNTRYNSYLTDHESPLSANSRKVSLATLTLNQILFHDHKQTWHVSSSRSQVRPSTATHVPPSQSSTSGSHLLIRISDDDSPLAVHSKQGETIIMATAKTWSQSENNWNTSSNNWSSSLNSRSPSCLNYRQLELVQTVKTGKLRNIAFFPKSHIMVTLDVSGEVDWFVQKL